MKKTGSNAGCRVTLSANAGISVMIGDKKIWIDALHDEKDSWYSTLTEKMLEEMKETEAFCNPNIIVVTHGHSDHYSEALVEKAAHEYPDATFLMPWKSDNPPETVSSYAGGLQIEMIKLPHEGKEHSKDANYCCLITSSTMGDYREFRLLILGDTEIGSEMLCQKLEERGLISQGFHNGANGLIDIVIADYPWAAVIRGRKMLDEKICPRHLLIYHLPFEGDDVRGLRNMTARAISRFKSISDIRLLKEFLQTESIRIGNERLKIY